LLKGLSKRLGCVYDVEENIKVEKNSPGSDTQATLLIFKLESKFLR
jgi:hypothetical protein